MSLFDNHDGSIYQLAECDGHSGQRHDVGTDTHHPERYERQQHRDRHSHDRDCRAGEVPQKDQDDQHYGDDDLDDRLFHCANRVVNELRPVIDRNDLHACRKSGLYLFDLGFNPVDHIKRVLAVPHDHNPGYDFARTIQVGEAAPQVGPHHHLADVFYTDLRPGITHVQWNVFKILKRARVTPAPHHVLRPAKFQQPSTRFAIPSPYRLHHAANRDPIRPQSIRVEIHLVLARIATDWRHLGHALHRPNVITQIPVLIRTQIRQAMLPRGIHQSVLINPSESRSIRAQFGLNPFWQTGNDTGEILHDSRARPIQIRSVLKDDVHVRVAEIGEAPDGLHLRRSQHRRDDWIGDLVLDYVRTSVPV